MAKNFNVLNKASVKGTPYDTFMEHSSYAVLVST